MAEDQIQEVKDRIDIVSLISEYLPLKKAGRNYKALCPFHQEKTPSFMVSSELQIFKCFGCGKAGDAFTFLKEIEGLEFSDALRVLADKAGIKLKRYQKSDKDRRRERLLQLTHLTSEVYHHLLTSHKIGNSAYKYLKDRGITKETIEKFSLGYAPTSWDFMGNYLLSKKYTLNDIISAGLAISKDTGRKYYDRFRERVIFPLRDTRSQVVGFAGRTLREGQPKYINSPETELFFKGSYLYGLDLAKTEIRKQKQAIVVEGLLDVISPHQAGIKNIVASQGTALTLGQLKLLQKLTDTLTFCYDTDKAGEAATKRGIALAQEQNMNLQVVLLPTGKDPDDAVREDREAFIKAIEGSVSITDFYFNSAFSKWDATSALGKKRISVELIPIINTVVDSVEKAHYVKRLAEGLGVGEKIIGEALSKYQTSIKEGATLKKIEEVTFVKELNRVPAVLEEYIFALLFKSSISLAQSITHKLAKADFTQGRQELLAEYKNYISGRKRALDIKTFRAKLEGDLKNLAEKLYLWDLGGLEENEEAFLSEVEAALKLLKNRSTKRALKNLSIKIKEAEKAGDTEQRKELANKFQELAQKLL